MSRRTFFPFMIDWDKKPVCKKLRRADGAHEGRWMSILAQAHRAGSGGELVFSDGAPMTVEDLADEHDHDYDGWSSFLAVATQLGLLETNGGEVIKITPEVWDNFHRAPSKEPEAEAARKRAERDRRKNEKLEKMEEELARLRSALAATQNSKNEEPHPVSNIEDPPSGGDDVVESECFEQPPEADPVVRKRPHLSAVVRTCPQASAAVRSGPHIDQDQETDLELDPDQIRSKTKSGRSPPALDGSLEKHVVLSEEEKNRRWWDAVQLLFERFVGKWQRSDRRYLEKHLVSEDWAKANPDLVVRYWTIRFALIEADLIRKERSSDPEAVQIGKFWPYALSLCNSYAVYVERLVQEAKATEAKGGVAEYRFVRAADSVESLMALNS